MPDQEMPEEFLNAFNTTADCFEIHAAVRSKLRGIEARAIPSELHRQFLSRNKECEYRHGWFPHQVRQAVSRLRQLQTEVEEAIEAPRVAEKKFRDIAANINSMFGSDSFQKIPNGTQAAFRQRQHLIAHGDSLTLEELEIALQQLQELERDIDAKITEFIWGCVYNVPDVNGKVAGSCFNCTAGTELLECDGKFPCGICRGLKTA